jgi:hypothetical protein
MKPETEKKLKKIKRISNVLRTICKVLLAIVTCGFVLVTVAILVGHGTLNLSEVSNFPLTTVAIPARLGLAVMTALTLAVPLKGLYHLHRLFGNYGRGDIFTTESAGQIRQLGITVLMGFGVNILWVVTAFNFMRSSPQTIQFHSDGLVIGPVIIVISWIMEMAAEMREENELTV